VLQQVSELTHGNSLVAYHRAGSRLTAMYVLLNLSSVACTLHSLYSSINAEKSESHLVFYEAADSLLWHRDVHLGQGDSRCCSAGMKHPLQIIAIPQDIVSLACTVMLRVEQHCLGSQCLL
jgi:hypothetical protein